MDKTLVDLMITQKGVIVQQGEIQQRLKQISNNLNDQEKRLRKVEQLMIPVASLFIVVMTYLWMR